MRETTTYPRLPEPPAQVDGEPAEYYGARLIAWCLATDTTATLSDAQLERAHYACTDALARRAVLGEQSTPACVYDRFETLRRTLYAVLEARATERAAHAPDVPVPPVHVDRPNLGPMARLQPIVSPRPPAGAYGRPEIQF